MIKVEKIDVNGFEAAIRGMRNPMNSWDRSDSYMGYDCHKCGLIDREGSCEPKKHDCSKYYGIEIGPNDLGLMHRLYKSGPEHRKYLRMIHVTMDVTAPLYWWKEYDTYKVSTVANSCSTMHKIHAKEFTPDDFSTEHMTPSSQYILEIIIDQLNTARNYFINTKDKTAWWQMIQLLPSSYNQKRTLDLNYETIINIIHQRTGHKLDEWNSFVEELKKATVFSRNNASNIRKYNKGACYKMSRVKEFISYFIEAVLNIVFCTFVFIGIFISVIVSCIYFLYRLFESIED